MPKNLRIIGIKIEKLENHYMLNLVIEFNFSKILEEGFSALFVLLKVKKIFSQPGEYLIGSIIEEFTTTKSFVTIS